MEYQRLINLVCQIAVERNFGSYDFENVDTTQVAKRLQRELEAADPGIKKLIRERYRVLSLPDSQPAPPSRAAINLFERSKGKFTEPRDILERTATHYLSIGNYKSSDIEQIKGDFDAQDLFGRTSLHYMCLNDGVYVEQPQDLINCGAGLDVQARDGATPLHYAAMRGREDKARLLIEAGATVDIWDLAGRSPLHTAAVHGHVAVVEYLWDKSRTELRDRWGWTVLHLAAKSGSDLVVKLLLRLKCDKEAKDRRGRTALLLAVIAGKKSVVTFLISEGANTDIRDNHAFDIFMNAVIVGRVNMVRLLIDQGLYDTRRYIDDLLPLATALRRGQEDMVWLLIDRSLIHEWREFSGRNLLHFAAMGPKNTIMIQELLDRGFDINAEGRNDMSPLHEAVQCERFSNVKFLIEKGANVNQPDLWGQTPLWAAIDSGQVHIVELLLDNGASVDVSSTESRPQTLLSMVKKQGNQEIIDMIRQKQAISEDDWEAIPCLSDLSPTASIVN
ncbi:hypothetical protein FPOAC2_07235 [Fusarium poae]|uniref:hypothetical protein n=1 Tax=Fusarium poae TaxID=36050 RepID=UPI001CEA7B37|nr:hypothetical protein FPOAC1_007083 [Fusarium poae]KAG8673764.1 hypothetical protein FPOAC1_007083 [Fusarium poae]